MKVGLIYIWFDKKHKRYYVGSHWGTEDDGYICSSDWMRHAYRRRPKDFKRRIIEKIEISSRGQLFEREQLWLALIKEHELGKRYYNLVNKIGIRDDYDHTEQTKEKLRQRHKEQFSDPVKRKKHSDAVKAAMNKPEIKEKQKKAQLGRIPWNKTKPVTEKYKEAQRNYWDSPAGLERRKERSRIMSENNPGRFRKEYICSEETKKKIGMANRARNLQKRLDNECKA